LKIKPSRSQKDASSTYQGFFAVGPSSTPATITATATPTCTTTAMSSSTRPSTSTAITSIADPTSLRCELDERMKKLGSEGNDYYWLYQQKYPAAIGLLVDYICSLFEHRKPTSTVTPQPETITKQEAIKNYRAFFFSPVPCHSRSARK
jgi:hypothetical protein